MAGGVVGAGEQHAESAIAGSEGRGAGMGIKKMHFGGGGCRARADGEEKKTEKRMAMGGGGGGCCWRRGGEMLCFKGTFEASA